VLRELRLSLHGAKLLTAEFAEVAEKIKGN
jgi:hypothetical protein